MLFFQSDFSDFEVNSNICLNIQMPSLHRPQKARDGNFQAKIYRYIPFLSKF
jgi:hypothetical protein